MVGPLTSPSLVQKLQDGLPALPVQLMVLTFVWNLHEFQGTLTCVLTWGSHRKLARRLWAPWQEGKQGLDGSVTCAEPTALASRLPRVRGLLRLELRDSVSLCWLNPLSGPLTRFLWAGDAPGRGARGAQQCPAAQLAERDRQRLAFAKHSQKARVQPGDRECLPVGVLVVTNAPPASQV